MRKGREVCDSAASSSWGGNEAGEEADRPPLDHGRLLVLSQQIRHFLVNQREILRNIFSSGVD